MRLLWLSLCGSLLCNAAITKVQILDRTSTQAVICAYISAGTPTIEVSESPDYAPLVHDVDPALFPGANSGAPVVSGPN